MSRGLLQLGVGVALGVAAHSLWQKRRRLVRRLASSGAAATIPDTLVVGTAQLRSDRTLEETVAKIEILLADAADAGVQVLVLPEAVLVGYSSDAGSKASPAELSEAEDAVRCRPPPQGAPSTPPTSRQAQSCS